MSHDFEDQYSNRYYLPLLITEKNKDFCHVWQKKKTFPEKKHTKSRRFGKEKPVILITNDDGVTAPGIMNLVEAVKDLGKIVVVAPDKPQSGMGHAITIGQPLRLHKVHLFDDIEA